MDKIEINKEDLLEIICEYDEEEYEAKPLNAKSYVDQVFERLHRERSKREDHESGCGALNTQETE